MVSLERMENQKIEGLIIRSLNELVEVLDVQIIGSVDSNTRIFGQEGVLDSMGLLTLITDLEEGIEDEFGVSLILADERAMSQKNSPFRTISSLSQYIGILIEEERHNESA